MYAIWHADVVNKDTFTVLKLKSQLWFVTIDLKRLANDALRLIQYTVEKKRDATVRGGGETGIFLYKGKDQNFFTYRHNVRDESKCPDSENRGRECLYNVCIVKALYRQQKNLYTLCPTFFPSLSCRSAGRRRFREEAGSAISWRPTT